jgi:hypothetical protein
VTQGTLWPELADAMLRPPTGCALSQQRKGTACVDGFGRWQWN